jgi:hypothetical protein
LADGHLDFLVLVVVDVQGRSSAEGRTYWVADWRCLDRDAIRWARGIVVFDDLKVA